MTIGIMPLDEKNMYIKTKIVISAKDPERSNVRLPVTELKFNIRGREKTEKQAFVFTKIDPGKPWGPATHPRDYFNIEVKAKPGASGTKIDENTEVDYGDNMSDSDSDDEFGFYDDDDDDMFDRRERKRMRKYQMSDHGISRNQMD